jgi:putative GTP pyrophosphokinase
MAKPFSKTQIDRLGDRLKKGDISEADLRLLDEYRRSFAQAFGFIVEAIRRELALELTERAEKSTTSIVEKLKRESIRLTQIQDIAGCRLIVPDIANQEAVVQSLKNLFERTTIIDRRQKPSHGYRAVHVVVSCLDKIVEIQVRTLLQQLWAELSERLSDVLDPAIKYGGGDDWFQKALIHIPDVVAEEELYEMELVKSALSSSKGFRVETTPSLGDPNETLVSKKQEILEKLQEAINVVSKYSIKDSE